MEIAPPSIADAVAKCVAGGATSVIIAPYFLSRYVASHPSLSVRYLIKPTYHCAITYHSAITVAICPGLLAISRVIRR